MGVDTVELVVDYLGCQQAMCTRCDYLQICPLHNKIDALRAVQHDMTKCPNCEKCIADLRTENEALRADVERLRKRVSTLTIERDLYLDSHDKANDFAQAICSLLGIPRDCWDFYSDLLEPLEDLKRDRDCLLAKADLCKP